MIVPAGSGASVGDQRRAGCCWSVVFTDGVHWFVRWWRGRPRSII